MNRNLSLSKILAPIIVMMIVVSIWHGVVFLFHINKVILPSPMQVALAAWRIRLSLLTASGVTLRSAAAGLLASAVVGSLVAILFSQSSILRIALYPYVIFLQTVPIVAIAPLLIIWSGPGFRTIVLVACIISIFPIISNVTSGLLSVSSNLNELFRMQSASRWQTLFKLQIPAAIPNLILGLRISCGLSVIGAIVGELFVSSSGTSDGLGALMNSQQGNLHTDELVASVIASTLLGILLFASIAFLGRVVLRRWTYSAGFEAHST